MGITPVNRWLLPVFLIAVCLVPLGAGGYRMVMIVLAAAWQLEFAPDAVDQLPLLIHSVSAVGFLLLSSAQFWPGLRQKHLPLHRLIGRVAVVLGLIGAASGLWMTLMHSQISGPLLYWGRLVFGTFWGVAIIRGFLLIRAGDFRAHRAWMIRAYATALPAGTMAFVFIPIVVIFGEPSEFAGDVIQVVAWPVHLAVAEWFIRRGKFAPISNKTRKGALA